MQRLFRLAPAAAGGLLIGVLAALPAAAATSAASGAPPTRSVSAALLTRPVRGALPRVPGAAGLPLRTTPAPRLTATGTVRIPPPPPLYYQTVKKQIARWLHLTVAQMKRKLHSETDLFYVASDRHVRDVPNQVPRHELAALQTASQTMVRRHVWTHQQADANMRYWRHVGPKLLTDTLSQWFRER